ncbi:GNAT domain-domain-containing protein [Catenaria anguillulae PL171]|uniref:GNAT domain-domain-containing protein n=1 Tax=Catenaria anguillulae PL171 TaxID=765915 RepID=A0A1Y2HQL2_9FUNG|nr:GNAT domain-domain-containing protein [Catenaria anguillulae PL171]
MKLNATTVLLEEPLEHPTHSHTFKGRLTLVPYLPCHVAQYHEWMKSPELLAATASEPLTMKQEYEMQQAWRADPDKLTFILLWSEMPLNYDPAALVPVPVNPTEALALDPEAANRMANLGGMVGDVNLFFHAYDNLSLSSRLASCPKPQRRLTVSMATTTCQNKHRLPAFQIAELEVMIAEPKARGHGLAQRALAWIMHYARQHVASEGAQPPEVGTFRAIVGWDNVASRQLFANKLRFKQTKSVDVFRESHLEWHWPASAEAKGDWPFPEVPKYREVGLHDKDWAPMK